MDSGKAEQPIVKNAKKRRMLRNRLLPFPYFILAVLLITTVGITYIFYRSAKAKDTLRFNNETARLHYSIENKLRLYITLLRTSRGFIETSPTLDRKSFAEFAGSLNFPTDFSGVQGIGFAQIFQADELEKVQNKLRGEGLENYTVFPGGSRERYAPVVYVQPVNERNNAALGFDMLSEPVRREAIERACDTGDIAMSGKIVPLTDNDQGRQFGFLIYLPIYNQGTLTATVADRRKNIRAFVYLPFRANVFINEVYRDESKSDLGIKIFDGEPEPENMLAETVTERNDQETDLTGSRQIVRDQFQIANRKWTVEYYTLPAFAEQSSVSWSPLILISGLTFSFLLFGMSLWEAKASREVEKTARELIQAQSERDVLFENEKAARKNAEEANAAKDEFIAIVSHELKTPLNAIGGWTRILKSSNLSDNIRETALHKINKNLRLQTAMVEQLLNYSELISGEFVTDKKKIDFSALLTEAASEIQPLFEEKNIEFEQTIQSGNCYIEGDEEKLKVVIYNLFSNALKFTPDGGRIEAEIIHDPKKVILTIKDNGKGISREFLPQVFESYKQADKPNVRSYGGLGLGMTITKTIVNLHGGKIEVGSAGEGKGTIFKVELPCVEQNK